MRENLRAKHYGPNWIFLGLNNGKDITDEGWSASEDREGEALASDADISDTEDNTSEIKQVETIGIDYLFDFRSIIFSVGYVSNAGRQGLCLRYLQRQINVHQWYLCRCLILKKK